jgi:opacity protein-like surface antigen
MKFKTLKSRLFSTAAAGVTALLLGAGGAQAEELGGTLALYGWLPSMRGETPFNLTGRTVETEMSARDMLESLQFGMMAAGEVHYGRVSFMGDLLYASLANDGTIPAAPAWSTDVKTKMLMTTFGVGYAAYAEGGYLIQPYVGARYVMIDTDVKLKNARLPAVSVDGDVDTHWWDPVVGVRGRVPLNDKWTLGGIAEVGGFGAGSDITWQLYAGVEYAVSEHFNAHLGYRYLGVRYSVGPADLKLDMYGPLLGVSYRF